MKSKTADIKDVIEDIEGKVGMADKENNDVEGFDAEIEEAAASLDADSSFLYE